MIPPRALAGWIRAQSARITWQYGTAGGAVTGVALGAVSSGVASINVGGRTVSAAVVRGLTLAAGDPVLVSRQGSRWWVLARTGTAAVSQPDESTTVVNPPDPKPTVSTGVLTVAPTWTGTYRVGPGPDWRTDTHDVIQGEAPGSSLGNNRGCAFYGKKPRSLDGATVTRATVRVRRIRGGDYASRTATLRLVTESSRPSGAPTLTSSTSGPSLAVNRSDGNFVIPDSWAQAMVDGTAGGLALYEADGSPYMRFAGRGSDDYAAAWTMRITWRREH